MRRDSHLEGGYGALEGHESADAGVEDHLWFIRVLLHASGTDRGFELGAYVGALVSARVEVGENGDHASVLVCRSRDAETGLVRPGA
jgi:hypothetical protein